MPPDTQLLHLLWLLVGTVPDDRGVVALEEVVVGGGAGEGLEEEMVVATRLLLLSWASLQLLSLWEGELVLWCFRLAGMEVLEETPSSFLFVSGVLVSELSSVAKGLS